MNPEDEPLVLPWEEGPQAKVVFTQGGVPRVPKKTRRSSILKQPSGNTEALPDRMVLQEISNSPTKKRASLSRRVSFSAANFVKEFCTGKDELTVWNSTYEEEREVSGSSVFGGSITGHTSRSTSEQTSSKAEASTMEITCLPSQSRLDMSMADETMVAEESPDTERIGATKKFLEILSKGKTCINSSGSEESDDDEKTFIGDADQDSLIEIRSHAAQQFLQGISKATAGIRKTSDTETESNQLPPGDESAMEESRTYVEKELDDMEMTVGPQMLLLQEKFKMSNSVVETEPNFKSTIGSTDRTMFFNDEVDAMNMEMTICPPQMYKQVSRSNENDSSQTHRSSNKTIIFQDQAEDFGMEMTGHFPVYSKQASSSNDETKIFQDQSDDAGMEMIGHFPIESKQTGISNDKTIIFQDQVEDFGMEMTGHFPVDSKEASISNDKTKIFQDQADEPGMEMTGHFPIESKQTSSSNNKTQIFQDQPDDPGMEMTGRFPMNSKQAGISNDKTQIFQDQADDPGMEMTGNFPIESKQTSSSNNKTQIFQDQPDDPGMEMTGRFPMNSKQACISNDKTQIFQDQADDPGMEMTCHFPMNSKQAGSSNNKTQISKDNPGLEMICQASSATSEISGSKSKRLKFANETGVHSSNDRTHIFADAPGMDMTCYLSSKSFSDDHDATGMDCSTQFEQVGSSNNKTRVFNDQSDVPMMEMTCAPLLATEQVCGSTEMSQIFNLQHPEQLETETPSHPRKSFDLDDDVFTVGSKMLVSPGKSVEVNSEPLQIENDDETSYECKTTDQVTDTPTLESHLLHTDDQNEEEVLPKTDESMTLKGQDQNNSSGSGADTVDKASNQVPLMMGINKEDDNVSATDGRSIISHKLKQDDNVESVKEAVEKIFQESNPHLQQAMENCQVKYCGNESGTKSPYVTWKPPVASESAEESSSMFATRTHELTCYPSKPDEHTIDSNEIKESDAESAARSFEVTSQRQSSMEINEGNKSEFESSSTGGLNPTCQQERMQQSLMEIEQQEKSFCSSMTSQVQETTIQSANDSVSQDQNNKSMQINSPASIAKSPTPNRIGEKRNLDEVSEHEFKRMELGLPDSTQATDHLKLNEKQVETVEQPDEMEITNDGQDANDVIVATISNAEPKRELKSAFSKLHRQNVSFSEDVIEIRHSETHQDPVDLTTSSEGLAGTREDEGLAGNREVELSESISVKLERSRKQASVEKPVFETLEMDHPKSQFDRSLTADTPIANSSHAQTDETDDAPTKMLANGSVAFDQSSTKTDDSSVSKSDSTNASDQTDSTASSNMVLTRESEPIVPESAPMVPESAKHASRESVKPRPCTASKDRQPKLDSKKKNVNEFSIFEYLLSKQEQVAQVDDPYPHGRFEISELDLSKGHVQLSFLKQTLSLNIRLGHPLPSEEIEDCQSARKRTVIKHWTIRRMEFQNPSRILSSKKASKIGKLAHFLLLRQLKSSWFNDKCPTTCSLKDTLSSVSVFVNEAARFMIDLYEIQGNHSQLAIDDDYKLTVGFYNTKVHFAFTIQIDFSKGFGGAKNPDNVVINHLASLYNSVKDESIMALLKAVPAGWKFLKAFVYHVDLYCDQLSKTG